MTMKIGNKDWPTVFKIIIIAIYFKQAVAENGKLQVLTLSELNILY